MYTLVVWIIVIVLATGFAIEEPSEKEDFDYQLIYDSSTETRTIDQHVVRLRKKLGEKKNMLKSIPAFGYKILNS